MVLNICKSCERARFRDILSYLEKNHEL
jgi:hypothetical protein